QFVRDVRDQFAALPVGGGQVCGHLVERVGEFTDLVPGSGAYPAGVVAPGHRPGGGGHLPQRGGHAVRQYLGNQQRDRERGQRGGGGPPADAVPEDRDRGGDRQHHQDADLQYHQVGPLAAGGRDRLRPVGRDVDLEAFGA